jgi:Protein of unknown function (DUF3617)
MFRSAIGLLITTLALALAAPGTFAQSVPPMKSGLWRIRSEREENGQRMPDGAARMKERMKTMTPEKRQQFEEMMKKQGVVLGDGTRFCYSQSMLERGAWADQGGCKTDFSNRSSTSWKWHSSCPALGYEGDGEAHFSDSGNFVVKSTGVTTSAGKSHTSTSTRTGTWLSADCGDVKPIDAKP